MNIAKRQVRAVHDADSITVYQAAPSHFDRRVYDDAAAWCVIG